MHPSQPGYRRRPAGRRRIAARRGMLAAGLVVAVAVIIWALSAGLSGTGAAHSREHAAGPPRGGHPASPDPRTPSPRGTRAHADRHTAAGPPGPAAGTIGRYRVRRLWLGLVDQDKRGRGRAGLGPRSLPTVVRYPVSRPAGAGPAARPGAAGPFPLVVFAPGYLQCPDVYAPLLRAWASAGYVVAAVTFPLTNCDSPGGDEGDLSHEPGDMSFVISALLARSAHGRGALAGLINPREIAVAGHSDGGDATAAIAANTCCADHRVKAAVVLAGAEWPPLGGRYFPPGSPPVMFVQGSADTINPPYYSVQLYRADTAGVRYYLDVFGASHLTPVEGTGADEHLVAAVTARFLARYLDGHGPARAALARRADAGGLAHLYSHGALPP